jgi:hypothetical protein
MRLVVRGNQPGQHAFLADMAPGESLYQGGFGAGKTHAGAIKLLRLHWTNKCDSFAAAPTNGDLWRVVVPKLCETLRRWRQSYELRRSDPYCLTVWGLPIWLLSCQNPERFAGFEAGAGWIDEAARTHAHAEPQRSTPIQARGRIRNPRAAIRHLLLTTTPEGLDTWVEEDFGGEDPRRRRYFGATRLNTALAADQADEYAAGMPAQLAAQYLEGRAVRFAVDRAHPGFGAGHIVDADPDPAAPLLVGMDWNVSPLCWVACQLRGDCLVVVDEMVIADHAQVDRGVLEAHARGWGRHAQVVIHPDRTGSARSLTGDPSIIVAEQTARQCGWPVSIDGQAQSNPPVVKRVNHLDMLISPALGRPRLQVARRCTRVIDELSTTSRRADGQYDPGKRGDRGHILDSLGYVAWNVIRPLSRMAAG